MPESIKTKISTIDSVEIHHFAKDSSQWWDEGGPFAPLHRLNPVRMAYIKDQICKHFDLNAKKQEPFKKLDILDIGCGGGLVCEPLARLGANVTGADADESAIATARQHAQKSGVEISYIAGDAAQLTEEFDVVLALEIIEHVSDIPAFISLCKQRLKPGGLLIFSTLNRTAKSYALGIIVAEYLLRWVPKGTHNWKKFVRPSELAQYSRQESLHPDNMTGLIYNPLSGDFALSETDIDVNYLMSFKQQGKA